MGLFGKKKISASVAGATYLVSLEQTLSEYWPQMAKELSPMIQIPLEHLTTDAAINKVFLAIVSTHYHALPKLFDEGVTDSLRRSIWYGITREDYSLGDALRAYLTTMEDAEKEGELHLSIAAGILYEQLGGDSILFLGTHRIASPTSIMALTEIFVVFDLDWWKQLQSEFRVIK